MKHYRSGSLAWQIAERWADKRQLECGAVYYGWPEASMGFFSNRSKKRIAAIDEELADAVELLRELGLVQANEDDDSPCVEDRTIR